MYSISLGGIRNALSLLAEGASPIVFIAGVVGAVALTFAAIKQRVANQFDDDLARGDAGWILLAPAGVVAIQFFLLADGKPPEYARFALLPITFLLVAAFTAIGRLTSIRARSTLAVAAMILTLAFGSMYVVAFLRDCGGRTSRTLNAGAIHALIRLGSRTLHTPAEPAPYVLPPLDLFDWNIVLAPPGVSVDADVSIAPDHANSPAPISWADIRFRIDLHPREPFGGDRE